MFACFRSPELNPCELVFAYVVNTLATQRGARAEAMIVDALTVIAGISTQMMDAMYKACILDVLQ